MRGGDHGDAPAASTGACPLDEAKATAAVGLEMVKLDSAPCAFKATSPGPHRLIEIYYSGVDAVVYEGSEGEEVTGVGDGARWDTQMSKSLIVKNGRRHFSIQALLVGTDFPPELQPKAVAVRVANLVLGD